MVDMSHLCTVPIIIRVRIRVTATVMNTATMMEDITMDTRPPDNLVTTCPKCTHRPTRTMDHPVKVHLKVHLDDGPVTFAAWQLSSIMRKPAPTRKHVVAAIMNTMAVSDNLEAPCLSMTGLLQDPLQDPMEVDLERSTMPAKRLEDRQCPIENLCGAQIEDLLCLLSRIIPTKPITTDIMDIRRLPGTMVTVAMNGVKDIHRCTEVDTTPNLKSECYSPCRLTLRACRIASAMFALRWLRFLPRQKRTYQRAIRRVHKSWPLDRLVSVVSIALTCAPGTEQNEPCVTLLPSVASTRLWLICNGFTLSSAEKSPTRPERSTSH